jgi:hypothetical protein
MEGGRQCHPVCGHGAMPFGYCTLQELSQWHGGFVNCATDPTFGQEPFLVSQGWLLSSSPVACLTRLL